MAAPFSWSFTTAAAVGSGPFSIWANTATPAVASANDASAVELGVKFRSDVSGYVTGIRFYKGANNTGTHTGHLWSNTGQLLASATFTSETNSGWQQVSFSSAVAVSASTTYIASYLAPVGGYSYTAAYFSNAGTDSPPLHALANSDSPDGVYLYGSAGGFPTNSYNSNNYWVDLVFTTTAPAVPLTQRSATDFNAGTSSSTTVKSDGGGAVREAASAVRLDEFAGSSLSSNWATTSWPSHGGATSVTAANSILSILGAAVTSSQTYLVGTAINASVDFAAAPSQQFGLATGFASVSGNYWTMFSTKGTTNTLYARAPSPATDAGSRSIAGPLGPAVTRRQHGGLAVLPFPDAVLIDHLFIDGI
jgi:hypothetical protein